MVALPMLQAHVHEGPRGPDRGVQHRARRVCRALEERPLPRDILAVLGGYTALRAEGEVSVYRVKVRGGVRLEQKRQRHRQRQDES